jgi:hypothetical protein
MFYEKRKKGSDENEKGGLVASLENPPRMLSI